MRTDRISAMLVGSIVLTALNASIIHYAVIDSRARIAWVFHTYEVIGHSSELLSRLSDAESKQRGYLMTGDSSHIRAWDEIHGNLTMLADAIRHRVSDNPAQTQFMRETIDPLLSRKTELLQHGLTVCHAFGRDSAFAFIKTNKGKATMDSLRDAFSVFTGQEKQLLLTRLAKVEDVHERQIAGQYIMFSLIAAISFVAWIALVKNKKKNDNLIVALKEANQSLEQRVGERTRELKEKNEHAIELNEKLQMTLEEVQSFNDALQVQNSKTEDTLREIRDLYNNAPVGYHSLDAHGTFVRINDTELSWLGYTREEIINRKKLIDIVTAESQQTFLSNFEAFKQSGFVKNLEFGFIRKDGSVIPVLLNATAVYDEHGEYVMSRSTVFDISVRKNIEHKLLEANERLMHLDEDKNHFLGVAVHDLKSPVDSILGLINLISFDGNNLTPTQHEYLRYIRQSCIAMKTLVTNLLDISRIEQGMSAVKKEVIDLNNFLPGHLKVFADQALKKGIDLILEDLAPGTKITSDPSMLKRILDNLISNALKFSPVDKKIIVRLSRDQSFVRIAVIDQGPGIAAEEMPRLFRKFQKLSARPTAGESSSGLGLSIVKELVATLQGKIYVESKVGEGAAFIIELPGG